MDTDLLSRLAALPQTKRKGVVFGVTCLLCSGVIAMIDAAAARTGRAPMCDDTMFVAAHPGLDASSEDTNEASVRRFVVLMREVSASGECNERALREAFHHGSTALMRRFADGLKQNGGVERFLNRRHAELVTVALDVEQHSSTEWVLRWTEHIRSPSGDDLRLEHYAGELRTRDPKGAHAFEVAEFNARQLDEPHSSQSLTR